MRSGRWRLARVLSVVIGLCHCQTAPADRLVLRDEAGAINGQTIAVSEAGVVFNSDAPNRVQRLVTLDRVRELETSDAKLAAQWETHRAFSEQLWRGRSRVERGDYALAEPVLVALFRSTIGRSDPTSLIVCEGLLRCRLARGAHTLAVLPWLETRRLMQAGQPRGAYLDLDPIVDPVTGLCVNLPPVWPRSMALEKLVTDLDAYAPVDAPGVKALSDLYAQSARLAIGAGAGSGSSLNPADVESLNDPGVTLAWALVVAEDPSKGWRPEVDRVVARHLREGGAFTPWAYFIRGMIRARSVEPQEQSEGLVDLLTVPAVYPRSASILSGFALAQCADILEGQGRADDAASLRAELEQGFPGHPLHQVAPRTAFKTTKD